MARKTQFTIFDKMEQDGAFDHNPANVFARDHDGTPIYQGPIEYPKMFYHPEGKEEITRPADEIMTPFGPKRVGEQRQLIAKIARNREEELEFLRLGWHSKPRDAVAVRLTAEGRADEIPTENPYETEVDKLRKELERLSVKNAELEAAVAKGAPAPSNAANIIAGKK